MRTQAHATATSDRDKLGRRLPGRDARGLGIEVT